MRIINKTLKMAMLLVMLMGITFSVLTFLSVDVNAGAQQISKGVISKDEATGDTICIGTGIECDQLLVDSN